MSHSHSGALHNALEPLQVHPGGRYLMTASGRPFFWLGDTAWELFHRLTRSEAAQYFALRQRQGFNVIQAVALAELHGLSMPNAYGQLPLYDGDPTRPNEAYFAYVDKLLQLAAVHGLYVGLLPTWGDKVAVQWGPGPAIFSEQSAFWYGQYLGRRYRQLPHLVWILGGDRAAVTVEVDYRPVWRAMAAGIAAGLGANPLLTYHPQGGTSSALWLHDEPWLSFNMLQSGHGSGRNTPVWQVIEREYRRAPARPVLDGEPNYEDHPVNPWPRWNPEDGYFRDDDVRKQAYRSVFAGGCGVTYGHHSVWQFYAPGREPITFPERPWPEALGRPGAWQMRHLRALVESRPYFQRVPAQRLLLSEPGAGARHVRASAADDGSYALVYLPTAQAVSLDLGHISGGQVRAWWYDPRSGSATRIGEYPAQGSRAFHPPQEGPDWVLVLDDATRGFAAPGSPGT